MGGLPPFNLGRKLFSFSTLGVISTSPLFSIGSAPSQANLYLSLFAQYSPDSSRHLIFSLRDHKNTILFNGHRGINDEINEDIHMLALTSQLIANSRIEK